MLGMMTLMPSICFADSNVDSLILNRVWNYRRNYTVPAQGAEQNVYMRYSFGLDRRNALLFLVPTMYVLAKGDRHYVGESYCKIAFREADEYDIKRQVVCGTIPRHRTAMPAMLEFSTPDFYDDLLYPDHVLSPFYKGNKQFYRYKVRKVEDNMAVIRFAPRKKNTMLVKGFATVDALTGRLQSVDLEGEYDMMSFKVSAEMDPNETHSRLPKRCTTDAVFNFLGNKVTANYTIVYNCPRTLPDSLDNLNDRSLMEDLRPIPLNLREQKIYDHYDSIHYANRDTVAVDTTHQETKHSFNDWIKTVGWDIIGYNLINGNGAEMGAVSMNFSPLFNPLYLGYSQSRGISYKLRLGFQYNWNAHRYLTLDPQFGYNFKLNQVFYTVPLRMTYNPKRNGYAEITVANGNHTSNGVLADDFNEKTKGLIDMPDFKDLCIQAVNNVVAFDWLEIMTGIVFHRRLSLDRKLMSDVGMESEFRSFAPSLTVRLSPWYNGPVLTANFEQSIKNVFRSNLDYQRWEFDASYLKRLPSMRILNLRAGAGFYTQRNSNYFADFENFRANNLPTGWEDDWAGQFQLLNSLWYNQSDYYVRGHVSFDTPMLALSYLPWVGRYLEVERIYLSALSIQHTRPYMELGYGFTTRYFSTAVFTNLLGGKIQEVGCKFTVELFRRW
jgi:hypothetical protein